MLIVITFKVDNMRKIVENSIMRCLVFGLMICMCLQASGQEIYKTYSLGKIQKSNEHN
jgi:hypothetical protein